MKSWAKHLRDFVGLLQYLRPYLGAGRGLLLAVLVSSLVITVFEGVGVGLLVPLLSLLLGGEQAKPMRPIQFLQAQFPGHSPAFYVGVCCVAIVGAIAAKNVGGYVSQIFSAPRSAHRCRSRTAGSHARAPKSRSSIIGLRRSCSSRSPACASSEPRIRRRRRCARSTS